MRFNDRAMALAGIPDLPADAFKKEGGKIKLHGGGGQPAQPTSTTQTTTTIPAYARPSVERMLGKTEALTNAPYRAYRGQRVAEFSPLQQEAFQAAQNLGPAQQIGYGTKFAGLAGLRAGQMGYDPSQFYSGSVLMPGMTQAYMSPYQQSVSDIEKREALRQSNIMGQGLQAQAARAGAFGGTRQALQEAERQRNLLTQMGDIQARGGQAAYDRALQQFNAENQAMLEAQRLSEASRQFGANIGMQANQQQLAAAQAMRELGGTQFSQQEGAMRARAEAGALQQARQQQILDAKYQDFLNQQADQYRKLSFMSDVLRGGPLTQATEQRFQAPPSPFAQVAGAGMSALALRQLARKKGGLAKSYANGGLVGLAVDQLAKG